MPHIHDIEYTHLVRILRYALEPTPTRIQEWATVLSLAHVCGLWSDILDPFLMRTVIVSLSHSKSRSGLVYSTNAHIIRSRNYHWHADTLCVEVEGDLPSALFFDNLLNALDSEACEWSGLRTLSVQIVAKSDPEYILESNISINQQQYSDISTHLQQKLAQCMPYIRRLSFKTQVIQSNCIANTLAKTYCHQLYSLKSQLPLSLPRSHFCSNLSHLTVVLDSSSRAVFLPPLRALPLQHLSLSNVPQMFSWDEFCDFEGYNLHFANLTHLSLSFCDEHENHLDVSTQHNAAQPRNSTKQTLRYKLHFPKLLYLCISNCPPKSPLFNSQKYFAAVPKVVINGPIASVSYATDLGLHNHKSLSVHIAGAVQSQERILYRVSGYFFSQIAVEHRAALSLNIDFDRLDISSIRWTNLTLLVVSSVFKVDCLLHLMFALPNLTDLAAYRLDVNLYSLFVNHDFSDDMNVSLKALPENTSWFPQIKLGFYFSYVKNLVTSQKVPQKIFKFLPISSISPVLATKIKTLALYYDENSPGTLDLKNEIVGYILAKVGCLQKVTVDPVFRNSLDTLKTDLQSGCTHMVNIQINYIRAEILKDTIVV